MKARNLLIGVLVLATAVASAQQSVESFAGKKLPAFKAKTVAGKPFTNASIKGKVVIMDFWATWCGPCRAASPIMQSLHTKYGKKGLLVVGANVEGVPNSKPLIEKYAKDHKYTYLFTMENEKLSSSLSIHGIPTMLVIDKTGTIKKVLVGYGPTLEKDLEKVIKPLL